MMTNISTDLLRTLVAVVDLGSFTKAAVSLGLTQPAVSAQIKRLQFLLGGDLLDRSVPGISLTAHGEMVVGYARRLLSLNDQIVRLGSAGPRQELVIRVGTSSDHVASILPSALMHFRKRRPDARFTMQNNHFEPLLRSLRSGELDVIVGPSLTPPLDAHRSWADEMVWVRDDATRIYRDRPVPLLSCGRSCVCHEVAVTALKAVGLHWEDVFTGSSISGLAGAVAAGLGVMAIVRRVAMDVGMSIWEDTPLPKLPDVYYGIYVREGGTRLAYEQLADDIDAALHPLSPSMPKLAPLSDKSPKASPPAA